MVTLDRALLWLRSVVRRIAGRRQPQRKGMQRRARGSPNPFRLKLAWRALKSWFIVVGLVAFCSAPVECFEATIEVIRRLFKLVFILGPKHYYYRVLSTYYGLEL